MSRMSGLIDSFTSELTKITQEKKEEVEGRTCPKCGAKVGKDDTKCPKCGASLEKPKE